MNPELKRNLLIEFTVQRLVAMPVIIGLVVLAAWVGAGPESVVNVAQIGFWAFILLWGTRKVASAFDAELVNNTWDSQRLSALSASELFLGKFLGAPAFVFYGAGLLLAVEVSVTLYALHVVSPPIMIEDTVLSTGAVLGAALRDVLSVFLTLAVSMLVAVLLMKRRRPGKGISVTLAQISGIATAIVFVQSLNWFGAGGDGYADVVDFSLLSGRLVEWYGFIIPLSEFVFVTLLVFLAWTVLGIVRELRGVLQFRSRRWAWALFVLFAGAYFAGFDAFYVVTDTLGQAAFLFCLIFWVTAVSLTYIVLFIEAKPINGFRALASAARSRRLGAIFEHVPLWLLSLLITWAVLLAFLVFSEPLDLGSDHIRELYESAIVRSAPAVFLVAASLFAVRDCLLVLVLNLGERPVRSDLAALIYLAVLYFLIPLLLGVVALEQSQIMAFFIPRPDLGWLPATVPALLQIAVLMVLAALRWRKIRQPLRTAG